MTTRIRVNGREREVQAATDTPLLWVLRDELRLTGTKYGCGIGMCGACTVHLDGVPVRSCALPLSAVGSREVTTIEALEGRAAEALRRAWVELAVPQCGYCQSGQLMAAAALLASTPRPGDEEIDAALAGNLCRCAAYHRIRAGIHRAAELLEG
ncbi:MAG: (2Fe-2S)-binding protein [Gammaproteobacteria bacterium]|nr:MAG: (2Fe-2S)-binding protein [Gammaproteobacteria bacterium]